MPHLDPQHLADWSYGTWGNTRPEQITGMGIDTRQLRAGQGFVAVTTARRDGHDFLSDARARGASCALVNRVMDDPLPQLLVNDTLVALRRIAAGWRESFPFPVVAVTGSVGKTSTKEMLRACLGAKAHATEANLNNTLGVPLTLLAADPATASSAVIEVGMSEPGELGLSAQVVRPDVAVVTAVAEVHLEGVGSLAGIAHEKAELVRHLAPSGEAFVPSHLLVHQAFAQLASRLVALVFNQDEVPKGVRRVVPVQLQAEGAGWSLKISDPVLGAFHLLLGDIPEGHARNAALAALAARRAGATVSDITQALAAWRPLAGRGSIHRDGPRELHIDCYNASPASLADAAAAFVRRTQAPRLWVLGGMAELGARSRELHAQAGRNLPLGKGDRVIGFGGDADALAEACGGSVMQDLSALTAAIAAWSGPVLIKGSRAHTLERALPEAVRQTLGFH